MLCGDRREHNARQLQQGGGFAYAVHRRGGTADKLDEAARRLTQIGYLQCDESGRSVILLEFRLRDVPGSVTAVLELISEFSFNISYISSQENGSDYQYFKMGIVAGESREARRIPSLRRRASCARSASSTTTARTKSTTTACSTFISRISFRRSCRYPPIRARRFSSIPILRCSSLTNRGCRRTARSTASAASASCFRSARCGFHTAYHRAPRHRQYGHHPDRAAVRQQYGDNRSGGRYLFVDTGYAYCRAEMRRILRS